jgi:hypothetical protein
LATSFFLAYAGDVTRRRRVANEDRLASTMFAVWWYSAALVILNQAFHTILLLAGVHGDSVHAASVLFGAVPLAAAVWGLSYYILYLLTGRRGLFLPITLFYAGFLIFLFWFYVEQGRSEFSLGTWQAMARPEHPASDEVNLAFGLLLSGPILFAVGAYFVLALGERDPTRRYRLAMISGGFLLLFGMILGGYVLGWATKEWFPLVYQGPALLASFLSVAAYRPPRWIQRRFHVEPVAVGTA